MECSATIDIQNFDLPSALVQAGINSSMLTENTNCNFVATIFVEYPRVKTLPNESMVWKNAVSQAVECRVNDVVVPCTANPQESNASITVSSSVLTSIQGNLTTVILKNLIGPASPGDYIVSSGSFSITVNGLSDSCMLDPDAPLANVKVLDRSLLLTSRPVLSMGVISNFGNVTSSDPVIGAVGTVILNLTSTAYIPMNAQFQLYSKFQKSAFLAAFSNVTLITLTIVQDGRATNNKPCLLLKPNPQQALSYVKTGMEDQGIFAEMSSECPPVPQNTSFLITCFSVMNPTKVSAGLTSLQVLAISPLDDNFVSNTTSPIEYFDVKQGTYKSSRNAYDIASTVLFFVCLVISLIIVYSVHNTPSILVTAY
jgi:hypothetical protein